MNPAPDSDFDERFARVEGLLAQLSQSPDARSAEMTREVLATVLELHRRGLERLLELAVREDDTRQALTGDARVSAMLLLHGLHPFTLDERVARTLDALGERFRSKVESASFERRGASALLVRVVAKSSACSGTRESIKKDWEEALLAAVPDAEFLSIELALPVPALVTLRLRRGDGAERAAGGAR